MTKDKALKLALEALEDPSILNGVNNAKFLIKQALAQPEQEQTGIREIRVTETVKQEQESKSTIRALTEQCAALVWERDEFKKQVQQYEKNGVTCQTYRHKVEQSCAECNVGESCTAPPKRKGVDLTDEQIEQRIGYRLPAYGFDAIRQLIKENT